MKIGDLFLKIFTFMIFALIYGPIIVMVVFSFNASRFLGSFTGFTTQWYIQLFQMPDVWQAFYNSVIVAALTAILSVIFGLLAAYAMVRYSFRGKGVVDSLLYIPIIIPEIAEALTLLLFYLMIGWGLSLGFTTVLIGHIAYDISYCFVVLRARLIGFDKSLEEAAKTLGANEIQTFFRVTLPLLMPGVLAAALLGFTISYDDFYKTVFTTGPAFETLPLRIWAMSRKGGVTPQLNALTTIALAISMSLALVYQSLSKK
ncbi:MAG: ABC transporter permease [Candidatus Bathyarchaeia archaeon]